MEIKIRRRRKHKVRIRRKIFLILPLLHKGKLFWLSKVRLEKAFNGHKMKIIKVELV